MSTLIKYLLAILSGLLGLALLVWFIYELVKSLPTLLLTLGFIALIVLFIVIIEKIRQRS